MKAYHNTVGLQFDDPVTGNSGSGALVTIRVNNTQALASIYDLDEVAIANPLTADSLGNYAFKATDNIYDIIISEGTAIEQKLVKVEVFDIPASLDLINDLSQAYEFDTLDDAVASAIIFPAGKAINLKERSTGNGGGAAWDIVITSEVAPNGFNIVQSTANPTLSLSLRDLNKATISMYGVDELTNSTPAIQQAINNGYLDLGKKSLNISSQLALVDNVVIVSDGAELKRTAGVTPFDMIVADSVAIYIRGDLTINGQRIIDSLDSANVADRFMGLHLNNCTGIVDGVSVTQTVNGEHQAEGSKFGIYSQNSNKSLILTNLKGYNNDKTAIAIEGACTVENVVTWDNLGSGFVSGGALGFSAEDGLLLSNIKSIGSGFSGVSINGNGTTASNIFASGAASGYAGINIAHVGGTSGVDGSTFSNLLAVDNLGWGINLSGALNVTFNNSVSKNSGAEGLRIKDGVDNIKFVGGGVYGSGLSGVLVQGAVNDKQFTFSSFSVEGSAGSGVVISGEGINAIFDSTCTFKNNAQGGGTQAHINCSNSASAIVSGRLSGSLGYNVTVLSSSRVEIKSAHLVNPTVGNVYTASGGIVQLNGSYLDPSKEMKGNFTATSSVVTVPCLNAIPGMAVLISPANSAARDPNLISTVSSVIEGVSFSVGFPSTPAGTEVFEWRIL